MAEIEQKLFIPVVGSLADVRPVDEIPPDPYSNGSIHTIKATEDDHKAEEAAVFPSDDQMIYLRTTPE